MDDNKNIYQYEFSEMHRKEMYNRQGRERKAKTMVSVLQDYFDSDLKTLALLDVGSSTGLIANYLAMYFGEVVGIDIDRPAVDFSKSTSVRLRLVMALDISVSIRLPSMCQKNSTRWGWPPTKREPNTTSALPSMIGASSRG